MYISFFALLFAVCPRRAAMDELALRVASTHTRDGAADIGGVGGVGGGRESSGGVDGGMRDPKSGGGGVKGSGDAAVEEAFEAELIKAAAERARLKQQVSFFKKQPLF